MKVLLAEDEKSIRVTLSDDLTEAGHDVTVCEDGLQALAQLQADKFDVLVSDIKMPGMTGLELLREVNEHYSDTDVILMTAYGSIESAVESMKLGAIDYIRKPFLNEEVVVQLEKIAKYRSAQESVEQLSVENENLIEALQQRSGFEKIIGETAIIESMLGRVATVAKTDATVLITGESGTGKELVANAIHHSSKRADKPMVVLSCAILPDNLLEDELFGHEKGAFTNANARKLGRFERANTGTIFIDDIDDMSLDTQVKLLRVLQNRNFERLGGTQTIDLDIRVIVASKIDLAILVEESKFREDLYYRLAVVPVNVPRLRERKEDIRLLIKHFITVYSEGTNYTIDDAIVHEMTSFPWPGNVRQLENAVQRAIALSGDESALQRENLLPILLGQDSKKTQYDSDLQLAEVVRQTESAHISHVLKELDGQKGLTAERLGISRKTLWEKMRQYGLS